MNIFAVLNICLGIFNATEASLLLIGMQGTEVAVAWRNSANIAYCAADIFSGTLLSLPVLTASNPVVAFISATYIFASNLVRSIDFIAGKENAFCANPGLFVAAIAKTTLASIVLYHILFPPS